MGQEAREGGAGGVGLVHVMDIYNRAYVAFPPTAHICLDISPPTPPPPHPIIFGAVACELHVHGCEAEINEPRKTRFNSSPPPGQERGRRPITALLRLLFDPQPPPPLPRGILSIIYDIRGNSAPCWSSRKSVTQFIKPKRRRRIKPCGTPKSSRTQGGGRRRTGGGCGRRRVISCP